MKHEVKIGLFQAAGVATYITLVSTFMQNVERWLGQSNEFFAPVLFLTLLSMSVLICGSIVGYYPVKLFWIDKKPKKAIEVVSYTALFLFTFFAIIFGVIIAS